MDLEVKKELKKVIEALLFASSDPLPFHKIHSILHKEFRLKKSETLELMLDLKSSYSEHAFDLEEVAFGYQLKTRVKYFPYINYLIKRKSQEKLSMAAQEVLAIVAFKQSVTRAEIDAIRGVDSSNIIQTLLEKELIKPAGVKDVPGKPYLYAPAEKFFVHFGIKTLEELQIKA